MPVPVDVGLPGCSGLGPRGVGNLLLQVIAVLDRQFYLEENPERPQGDLGGPEFAELAFTDFDDFAVTVDQPDPTQV